jgi:hypothetical protein
MSESVRSVKGKKPLPYSMGYQLIDCLTLRYAHSLKRCKHKKIIKKVMAFRRAMYEAQFPTEKSSSPV